MDKVLILKKTQKQNHWEVQNLNVCSMIRRQGSKKMLNVEKKHKENVE